MVPYLPVVVAHSQVLAPIVPQSSEYLPLAQGDIHTARDSRLAPELSFCFLMGNKGSQRLHALCCDLAEQIQ